MYKKIIGIGTDIVNMNRIHTIFTKYTNRFLIKNFHTEEINYFESLSEYKKIPYLAKRFAAKEAVAKAFGSGIGNSLSFQDIAILSKTSGAPFVQISKNKIPEIEDYDIHISLSDDAHFAIAFAIVTK